MELFPRTAIVALAVVAAIAVGLVVFSRFQVPSLGEPVGDSNITREPSTPRSPSPSITIPTVAPPSVPVARARNQAGPGTSIRDMANGASLEQRNPRAARTIKSLEWIRDGIVEEEREAAEALIYLAATGEEIFDLLTRRAWLDDSDFRQAGPLVVDLEYIAYRDKEAALALVEMPFLSTIEPSDGLAVESLSRMAYLDIHSFQKVMRHPSIQDGITDHEAKIVALLDEEYVAEPSLMNTLLDPAITTVEEREVTLPLAGNITLAIIRTRPGSLRSMDLFEYAVRGSEALLDEPFPASYAPIFFTEAVPGALAGSNNGNHIAILSKYDIDDGSREAIEAGTVISHEVAHYYWRWSQPWLDEGAAEITAAYLSHQATGYPLEPVNYPCGPSQTIRHLEERSVLSDDHAYICNYAVGERFFLELFQRLGEEAFWAGLRSLYLDTSETKDQDLILPGTNYVRRAFAATTGSAAGANKEIVEEVIKRWYEGSGWEEEHFPDSRPVIAELPEVYGWINRSYVSLDEGGRPVNSFSVADGGEWAWLTLEYSHDYGGPPQEIVFDIVEVYEDGFPYRRDTLSITVDRRYSGGVQWLSVGPGPDQAWATGKHWIYVYHEGRKVAQVEYEVTP